jgi:uncharacterized protein YdhG (YjbR/CyaY superfamily)
MADFVSIDAYIEHFEGKTQEYLRQLRMLIHQAAPDVTELINYNIPAFALVKGGRRDQQIMIAGYKKHVGLYPHPETMAHFWDRLEKFKKARGSVQFPLNLPLPKDLILEMVSYRKEMVKNQQ